MKRERTPEQIQADKERMARIRAMRTTVTPEPELKEPNVPRPDFVSVYQWHAWLRDNGFNVGELPNE